MSDLAELRRIVDKDALVASLAGLTVSYNDPRASAEYKALVDDLFTIARVAPALVDAAEALDRIVRADVLQYHFMLWKPADKALRAIKAALRADATMKEFQT